MANPDWIPFDVWTASSVGDELAVQGSIASHQASLQLPNSGGWTGLMYAAYYDHPTVARYFLLQASHSGFTITSTTYKVLHTNPLN